MSLNAKQSDIMYRMIDVKGNEEEIKFTTFDIKRALKFLKWYSKTYKRGLLLQILPAKKVYDTKNKKVEYQYE